MHTTDRTTPAPTVHLLDRPSALARPCVTIGDARFAAPAGSERLLAFAALAHRPLGRHQVTATLWPTQSASQAETCLDRAIGRLRGCGIEVVSCEADMVGLREGVMVDVHQLRDWADQVACGQRPPNPMEAPVDALELLPGWDEDWVMLERRRLRQLVSRALEVRRADRRPVRVWLGGDPNWRR